MDGPITNCPTTGELVQHWLDKRDQVRPSDHEMVICPACASVLVLTAANCPTNSDSSPCPASAERISRREDAVIYRAGFSNQAGSLALILWDKSNNLAHIRSKPWLMKY
jgi:hypothetical protein